MQQRSDGRSGRRAGAVPWARRALLALVGLWSVAPGWACERGEDLGAAGVLHLSRCEPFARAMWMHPGASGVFGDGTRYSFGLARLNRLGRQLTGHDPDRAAVVPVLSMQTAPGTRVALMPTLRSGSVGASVIVSVRMGD